MAQLKAGAAKRSINPTDSCNLGGYSKTDNILVSFIFHRKSTGIHDDIYARSLALQVDGETVVMTALDLLVALENDITAIRKRAVEKLGRSDIHLLVGSVHNHAAPDTSGAYGGVPREYRQFLYDRASDAIVEAVRNLQPARIGFADTTVEGILGNNLDPKGNVTDPYLPVMRLTDLQERGIATLVNFPCHVNILDGRNTLVSADFAHYVMSMLESHLGGMGIYFNGAVGDMYPLQVLKEAAPDEDLRTFDQCKLFGETIAAAAIDAIKPATMSEEVDLAIRKATVDLPIGNWRLWLARWLRIIPPRTLYNRKVRTESWGIRLNDAQIVTIPGQILVELGFRLRARMTTRYKFILGCTNDDLVYIVPPEKFESLRGKEEGMINLGPNTWPVLAEAIPTF